MSKKPTKPNTEAKDIETLHKKVDSLDQKLDSSIETLNKKVDNVARELLKTKEDVQEIKNTMATKDDIREVLKAVDSFAVNLATYDKKAVVHDHRLIDHERRIVALESK